MHFRNNRLVASPTDLGNFLVCRHKTALELRAAAGVLERPNWIDPLAKILQDRGEAHEREYVAKLRAQGLTVVDLSQLERTERIDRTRAAIADGAVDVIVQGALANDGWIGYPDVLRKVAPGKYEPQDTKLARETRGGTILQLCAYSDLLSEIQGAPPHQFHVVTPVGTQSYRFTDFAAFYRGLKARFLEFAAAEPTDQEPATYPEPTDHCAVCRWFERCNKRRRADDHLSFVHGLGRSHRAELGSRAIDKLATLAGVPIPLEFVPSRGAKQTYEKLREQARLQLQQRTTRQPTHEILPPEDGFGLGALPEPRPGDLFLDLEGDPFGRPDAGPVTGAGNREYLFGLGRVNADGTFAYTARWAFTDAEEHAAFDATMSDIMSTLDADPAIHVYHYAPYEPTAFKRLMGRYAAREADIDQLLRNHRFVDLYAVVRRAIRAGVESYSIKHLEPFYDFTRDVALDAAGDQRRIVEIALETGGAAALVTPAVRADVEGYNQDDVRSTMELRNWLDTLRARQIERGSPIARPKPVEEQPLPDIKERAAKVAAVRERLLTNVPAEASARTPEQEARYHLAHLLDWHRREDKAQWWDYFRLRELPEEDLLDEPKAVAGLTFVCDVEKVKRSTVQRYAYPPQEIEIRLGKTLKRQDGKRFAEAVRVDRNQQTIDILVGPSKTDERPTALFEHDHVHTTVIENALMALGEQVADAGDITAMPASAARSLLLREAPALKSGAFAPPAPESGITIPDYAVSIAAELGPTTLAIQGPPGSGKTWTGARMIEKCIAAGLKVGVTAGSHKVIRNLLAAITPDVRVRLGHKGGDDDEADAASAGSATANFGENESALSAIESDDVNVLGGTAWLWSRPEFRGVIDVLFIDEAGQVSLANALAMSRAAKSLVLLGDPQQLDQPSKGSHPDGVGASALQHILGDAETMPPDRGLFLPVTWRLAPSICAFTSEVFYAGQLVSKPGLENLVLVSDVAGGLQPAGRELVGSGLWVIEVDHHGNRSASDEEAAVVVDLVRRLLTPGSLWIDEWGAGHHMAIDDIRILTPFNAHLARLRDALDLAGYHSAHVGTVDKFQGQEAAVSIYSMATSDAADAPRGMEFLYSLNRLNVATSRARCASIVVASPRLFEPDCQTPGKMRLANALARFREMAGTAARIGWPDAALPR